MIVFFHVFAGLSRRVILKDAETGRTQTYSTGSDVLAQQFALRVNHLFHLSEQSIIECACNMLYYWFLCKHDKGQVQERKERWRC